MRLLLPCFRKNSSKKRDFPVIGCVYRLAENTGVSGLKRRFCRYPYVSKSLRKRISYVNFTSRLKGRPQQGHFIVNWSDFLLSGTPLSSIWLDRFESLATGVRRMNNRHSIVLMTSDATWDPNLKGLGFASPQESLVIVRSTVPSITRLLYYLDPLPCPCFAFSE